MKSYKVMKLTITFLAVLIISSCYAQPLRHASPESLSVDSERLAYADKAIRQAVDNNEIPGAVLAVVHKNKMVHLKAFGNKQLYPSVSLMDVNTVFDIASLTKPITAISVMILIERGKLRLSDKVDLFIPGFKGNIRVVDLLTHTSGLPPYAPVDSLQKAHGSPNPDALIQYIATCRRDFEPKTDFQYSCLNFIVLQRIVETISGQNLQAFAKANIFDVLGMTHTDYCPEGEILKQIAPTTKQPDGSVLHGVVHDPMEAYCMA